MGNNMGHLFDRWSGRASNLYTLWPFVVPVGLAGAVTAYLSDGLAWINQFGAFGWWVAFLGGSLIAAAIFGFIGWARLKFVSASAIRKWNTEVDTVNPVQKEFRDQRIYLLDLVNPVTNTIENKVFYNCEIIGPISILPQEGGEIGHCTFVKCDMVPCKDPVALANVIVAANCYFRSCNLYKLTIFLPGNAHKLFKGIYFPTLTGDPEVDKLAPNTGIVKVGWK